MGLLLKSATCRASIFLMLSGMSGMSEINNNTKVVLIMIVDDAIMWVTCVLI